MANRCRDCNTRTVHPGELCHYCREYPVARELPPGRWTGGLVKRFEPDRSKGGRPCIPAVYEWDEAGLLAAHVAHKNGDRDDRTREGERLYQRERKRQQRARQSRQMTQQKEAA